MSTPTTSSSWLLVGEADFTFTYDLCRYLSTLINPPSITSSAYDDEQTALEKVGRAKAGAKRQQMQHEG